MELDDGMLDTGVLREVSGIEMLGEGTPLEEAPNTSEAATDSDVVASILDLVLDVVKVDNGTPVSLSNPELDPSTGTIVTVAWAPPSLGSAVLLVGIGVDVFENVKLRARLWGC